MAFRFRHGSGVRKHAPVKRILVIVTALFICVIGVLYGLYRSNLRPVDQNNTEIEIITIEQGMNEAQVSGLLEQRRLVRSALSYELYVRLHGKVGQMIAGSYEINPSMSIPEIADKLTSGNVATDLITILPAQRLDQLRDYFIDVGYSEDEVDSALDPKQYADHPALTQKPPLASLEGYLYPESFQKTATTPLRVIIEASLDQMNSALSDDLKRAFTERNLNIHEAVILASIVEREVSGAEDRATVAQVFLKRYGMGMMLGSDPTALFGAQLLGLEPSVFADTPYNTRLYAGLPPGPINNVSEASLRAIAYPADTDFLYFVSGDDGKTYFSKTLEEHEFLTREHCVELCRSY